jgi:hypothetical protein
MRQCEERVNELREQEKGFLVRERDERKREEDLRWVPTLLPG